MNKHISLVDNDETEALELAQEFANETGIDVTDARPCIARLFYGGLAEKSIGRKPGAFVVALELSVAGLPLVAISKHLEAYGGRCSPPLATNVLAAVLRSIKTGNYDKRQGCEKLEPHCIGDMCPFRGQPITTPTKRPHTVREPRVDGVSRRPTDKNLPVLNEYANQEGA